jgi:hypothetical protein
MQHEPLWSAHGADLTEDSAEPQAHAAFQHRRLTSRLILGFRPEAM